MALVIGPGGGGGTTQTLTTQPLSNFDVSGTPVRLAVDAQGKLYISDPLRHAVLVYSNNGLFLSTIQGIEKPLGIAVDGSGTLYVGDAETGSVLIYDGSGHYVTRLGSGEGEFVYPNDIAISSSGNIFVADSAAHVVKAYSSAGSFSFGDTVLLYPTGIVVDDIAGEVYVSDDPSKSIIVFDLNGLYRRTIRLGSSFSPTVLRPQGLSVDAQNIYIADAYNSAIAAYTKSGTFIKFIGNYGSNLGEMRVPLDAALDRDGKLFVANYNNERIEEIGIGTTFTDISVSPAMVQFTVHECTALPSQTVNVSSGASAVAWTAYATVPWITL
ncbi:MAG: NHL repeat-containing protein, partial [bacterium]